MFERNSKLINRKFYQYLIPSILTIFAMQFASLLDGIIVGNLLGSEALSATSMVVPILYIAQMPGLALGVGGSIVVGNLLGKRDLEKANKAFSICFLVGIGLAIIFAILAPVISLLLANLFAPSLAELTYPYILMYLVTDPVLVFALLLASFMSVDNNPKLSSSFYIGANIVKISSMFLFIQVFKWGLYGAALSTAFGFFVSCLHLIFYIRSKKRTLSFTFKLKGSLSELKASIKASSAVAINYTLAAISIFIINIYVGILLVDMSQLVIFGVISNMVFVFDLFAGGIYGLVPTLCGIFYGEKDMYSLRRITRQIYLLNLGVTAILTVLIFFLPGVYSAIFGYSDSANQETCDFFVRLFVFSFFATEINMFSGNYYPSIEKNVPAYITVVTRQALFLLPLTLALLHTHGLLGFTIAKIATEVGATLFTYIYIFIYEKIKKKGKGIFMIETMDFISYDVSINNDIQNASRVSEEISQFLLENKIDNRTSQMLSLASEELILNIITYGYKNQKQNYIDVNVKLMSDKILLRIRDDGMPFDPTKYEFDNSEEYSTSGILLMTKLVDSVNYMRVLNLNTTTFEMKKTAI